MKDLKLLKKIASVLLLGLMFCVVQGCSDDEDNMNSISDLLGMWKEEGSEDYDLSLLEFVSNGSMIEYYSISNTGYYADSYTWTCDGSKLYLLDEWGDTYTYTVGTLTSSKLVLVDVEDGEKSVYVRYNGQRPNGVQHNGGTSDDWSDDNNSTNNPTDDSSSSATILPPTGVQATNSNGTVTITWNRVSGASKYTVWRSFSSTGAYAQIASVTGTSAMDTSPQSNSYNYYKVKAIGNGLESSFSDYANVYVYVNDEDTGNDDMPTVQKPSTPTGLKAVQEGESIVVTWNSVANTYYYRLWYSTPSGMEDFTNVYAPSTSCVFDQNMKKGTYKFWIQALNKDYDESGTSSKVSCYYTPGSSGNDDSGSKTKLDAPANLKSASDSYYVQISFDEVSGAYQYELYRSTKATSGYSKIAASGGSLSGGRYVLTDSNPKSGTTYYKVKAVALDYLGIEDSDYSNYIKVTR